MAKKRIALISQSGILGQIVGAALEQDATVELVPADSFRLSVLPDDHKLDLVILVLPGREAISKCRELLCRSQQLRILAVLEDETGDASLYELSPRETRLGLLSPRELVLRIKSELKADGVSST